MARKSLEYWATPAPSEYEAELDKFYALGREHARSGQPKQISGVFGMRRDLYLAGYRRELKELQAA